MKLIKFSKAFNSECDYFNYQVVGNNGNQLVCINCEKDSDGSTGRFYRDTKIGSIVAHLCKSCSRSPLYNIKQNKKYYDILDFYDSLLEPYTNNSIVELFYAGDKK